MRHEKKEQPKLLKEEDRVLSAIVPGLKSASWLAVTVKQQA